MALDPLVDPVKKAKALQDRQGQAKWTSPVSIDPLSQQTKTPFRPDGGAQQQPSSLFQGTGSNIGNSYENVLGGMLDGSAADPMIKQQQRAQAAMEQQQRAKSAQLGAGMGSGAAMSIAGATEASLADSRLNSFLQQGATRIGMQQDGLAEARAYGTSNAANMDAVNRTANDTSRVGIEDRGMKIQEDKNEYGKSQDALNTALQYGSEVDVQREYALLYPGRSIDPLEIKNIRNNMQAQRNTATTQGNENVNLTKAQTSGIQAETGLTNARTTTEGSNNDLVKAQTTGVNAETGLTNARTNTETANAGLVRANEGLVRANSSKVYNDMTLDEKANTRADIETNLKVNNEALNFAMQNGSDADVIAAYKTAFGKDLDPTAVAAVRGADAALRSQKVAAGNATVQDIAIDSAARYASAQAQTTRTWINQGKSYAQVVQEDPAMLDAYQKQWNAMGKTGPVDVNWAAGQLYTASQNPYDYAVNDMKSSQSFKNLSPEMQQKYGQFIDTMAVGGGVNQMFDMSMGEDGELKLTPKDGVFGNSNDTNIVFGGEGDAAPKEPLPLNPDGTVKPIDRESVGDYKIPEGVTTVPVKRKTRTGGGGFV